MSTDEVKETIAKLQDQAPVTTIGLSGGEPMLRPDLPEIISFIKSRGMQTLLLTNGTLLTEERVEETMVGGMYEVPLLSWRPEVHDRMVGREGAWEAVVEGMMNVHLAGGHLTVVFVATRQNWEDLYATAHLAMMLGAHELLYNRINAGAANLRFADELFLSPAMVEANLHTLDEIAVKHRFQVSAAVVIEPCVVDVRRFPNVDFGWCPLAGEFSAFIIDPAGNIRICKHSPVILGNIKRDHFRDIYYHHPYVKSFRTTLPQECENCEPPLKDMCRGGCKAAAAQAYGSFTHVEPFVRLNR
jgi:radical SAM protein with 4Fe4S-binding SPASM domain